jgi:hypothetical protein
MREEIEKLKIENCNIGRVYKKRSAESGNNQAGLGAYASAFVCDAFA